MKRKHGAFINTRYSTDRQSETSTETQVAECSNWCNRHGIPVLDVFSDEAVSGMKETRPRYQAMLKALHRGEADTVVIYDQSRTFRSLTAWFDFRNKMEAIGVRVVSVTQPMVGGDLRDPMNFMNEATMAVFNQMWVLQTRQKVIATMKHMARSGLHTGGKPPLGYSVKDGVLVVCEQEAAIVRRIFGEYASGRKYREIIDGLNSDGVTTRSGRPFGNNSLHDLLKNEKYIGTLVYGKAPKMANGKRNTHGTPPQDVVRIENAVPPLIDRETWDAVRQKMEANKRDKAGRPNTVRNYPLKGKVFCGECKCALVHSGSTSTSGRYHYYTCSGKQRLRNCDLKPIKMDELEQRVADVVRAIIGKPGNLQQLIQIMRNEKAKIQGGAVNQLETLISRQNEIIAQLDRATDAVLNGLSSPTLTKKIQELEQEKTVIEENMILLRRNMNTLSIPNSKIEELVQLAVQDNESVLALVARVEVSHDTITIWTIFDIEPDTTPPKGDRFSEDNSIPVDPDIFDCDLLIDIVGVRSPAPKKRIPQWGILFLISGGRVRTYPMQYFLTY